MTSSGRFPSGASGLQAALIRFAIRFRGVVVALAMVLLGYGVLTVMLPKFYFTDHDTYSRNMHSELLKFIPSQTLTDGIGPGKPAASQLSPFEWATVRRECLRRRNFAFIGPPHPCSSTSCQVFFTTALLQPPRNHRREW